MKLIFKSKLGDRGLDVAGSGKGLVAGCREYDNELPVSSTAGNLLNNRGTLSFLRRILLMELVICLTLILQNPLPALRSRRIRRMPSSARYVVTNADPSLQVSAAK